MVRRQRGFGSGWGDYSHGRIRYDDGSHGGEMRPAKHPETHLIWWRGELWWDRKREQVATVRWAENPWQVADAIADDMHRFTECGCGGGKLWTTGATCSSCWWRVK